MLCDIILCVFVVLLLRMSAVFSQALNNLTLYVTFVVGRSPWFADTHVYFVINSIDAKPCKLRQSSMARLKIVIQKDALSLPPRKKT